MTNRRSISIDNPTVTRISLDQFEELWDRYQQYWLNAGPFVSPAWIKAWWKSFAEDNELFLLCITAESKVLGVAPCMIHEKKARLIGSGDVCDYLDILVSPEHPEPFWGALLECFAGHGIKELLFEPVRQTSIIMSSLVPFARNCDLEIDTVPENVTVQLKLPASWEEYLGMLSKKQRHEVRRKFRRFFEAGVVTTRSIEDIDEAVPALERFFRMFRDSRKDKDRFMTAERESFFRELTFQLAGSSMLNLLEVEINNTAAAMVYCVKYGKTTYLYNNGFNPEMSALSAGVVSKLMTVRQSIESGMQVYNFLSGDEHYKFQLGGVAEPLFSCSIRIGDAVA